MLNAFSAGCLGALVSSLALWFLGDLGLIQSLGVSMTPVLTPDWLYARMVWGGLWGLLFILPISGSKALFKGSFLSLFPSAAQLFFVFPYQTHQGMGGIELGLFTPFLVLVFNWIWGLVTAFTIKWSK